MEFTSKLLTVPQLNELFMRAKEMWEIDQPNSEKYSLGTVEDYLSWAEEEVLANQ